MRGPTWLPRRVDAAPGNRRDGGRTAGGRATSGVRTGIPRPYRAIGRRGRFVRADLAWRRVRHSGAGRPGRAARSAAELDAPARDAAQWPAVGRRRIAALHTAR